MGQKSLPWLLTSLSIMGLMVLSSGVMSKKPPRCLVFAPSMIRLGEPFKAYVILAGAKNIDISITLGTQQRAVRHRLQNEQPKSFELRLDSLPDTDADGRYYVILNTSLSSPLIKAPRPIKVLVTLQVGHVFVQLNKLRFRPGDNMIGHLFSVDDNLLRLERDVTIDIMTPNGTVALRPFVNPEFRKFRDNLPEDAPEGFWEIQARYGHNKANMDVFRFEVLREEPEVFVTDVTIDDIIYPDTENITIELNARYLSGSHVSGLAEIKLFLKDAEGEKEILQGRIPTQDLEEGKATFIIASSDLQDQNSWFPSVDRLHLVVKAFVLDHLTGNDDTRGRASALFATSPYVIDLSGSAKNFKPDLPYTLKGDVYDNFGNVQKNIRYEVYVNGNVTVGSSGDGLFSTAILKDTTTFRVVTRDESLPESKQAEAELMVSSLKWPEKAYLALIGRVENGDKYDISVRFTKRNRNEEYDFIYYMVTSKERIIKFGYYPMNSTNQSLLHIDRIDMNMTLAPGFHVTVFYLNTTGSIITDSVWQNVERRCKQDVVITLDSTRVTPNEPFTMRLTGPPGAIVNTVIIDERQIRGSQLMITKEKLEKTLHENIGDCGRDGGKSIESMFYKSGLYVSSSNGDVSGPVRQSQICEVGHGRKRYRRSIQGEEDLTLYQRYKRFDQMIVVETMTLDGEGKFVQSATADHSSGVWSIHSSSFSSSGLCVGQPVKMTISHGMGRDMRVFIPKVIHVNQMFEIEAMVEEQEIPGFPAKVNVSIMVEEGICTKTRPLKLAPKKLLTFKGNKGSASWPMVALHPGKHNIKVYFKFDEDGDPSIIEKSFIALPEGVKLQEEQVMLLGRQGPPLENLPKRACFNITQNNYVKEDQVHDITIRTAAPPGAVYGSTLLQIGVISEPLGLVIKDILKTGVSFLIGSDPIGCGEQSMMYIGPMVFAAKYLKPLGSEYMGTGLEITVSRNITAGIVYMEKFRNDDGSYSTWPKKSASTWLTAYVAKIFAYATEFSDGNPTSPKPLKELICDSVRYITQRQRASDGAFPDPLGIVFAETVAGGLEGTPAMTAYMTISLLEVKDHIPTCSQATVSTTINKAITYLKKHVQNTTDVFTLSMISYALTLSRDPMNVTATNRLMSLSTGEKNRRYWRLSPKDLSESQKINLMSDPVLTVEIETAAYTLLALLRARREAESHKVAAWLVYQHKLNGKFISTQDTVIGLQALALYRSMTPQRTLKMDVELTRIDSGKKEIFKQLREDNRNLFQDSKHKIPESGFHDFAIKAFGQGEARLEISCTYYKKKEDSGECPFNMNLEQKDFNDHPSACSEFMTDGDSCFKICFSHPTGTRNMALLRFTFHHHQTAHPVSVQKMVNQSSIVDHAEINPHNVIFYLSHIPRQEHCVTFVAKTNAPMPINALPVAYQIFDYHDRDRVHCLKHYVPNPLMTHRQPVIRTVFKEEKKVYICAEKSAPVIHDFLKGEDNKEVDGLEHLSLKRIMCDSIPRVDYAYQVKFNTIQEDGESCYLPASIIRIVKNGTMVIDSSYRLRYKFDCTWVELKEWLLITAKDDVHLVLGKLDSVLDVNHDTKIVNLILDDENFVQRCLERKKRVKRSTQSRWKDLSKTLKAKYRKVNKNLKKFQCST